MNGNLIFPNLIVVVAGPEVEFRDFGGDEGCRSERRVSEGRPEDELLSGLPGFPWAEALQPLLRRRHEELPRAPHPDPEPVGQIHW